jgi:hypothetical protein
MVVATTTEVYGDRTLIITVTGLAADTNASAEVDLQSEMPTACELRGYPTRVTMQAARTGGATDVVAVELLASNITTVYAITQGVVSAVSSTGSDWVEEHESVPQARYYKVYTTTVGAGNTLTVTAVLHWGPL